MRPVSKTVLLIELETITELSMVVHTLIPAFLRLRQEHHCQFEASLVYIFQVLCYSIACCIFQDLTWRFINSKTDITTVILKSFS